MGQRVLRTHSLLAPSFRSSCSGAGPCGAQVEEATGDGFWFSSDYIWGFARVPVIANGLSFGVGKELPL